MTEREIQKRILLALAKEFHPHGLFWTRDVGLFVPVAAIKQAISEIIRGANPLAVLKRIRKMQVGLPGEPDIQGVVCGLWIGIEVKTAKGQQRDTQKTFQIAVEKAGGIYIIARSQDEAVEKVREALKNRTRGWKVSDVSQSSNV